MRDRKGRNSLPYKLEQQSHIHLDVLDPVQTSIYLSIYILGQVLDITGHAAACGSEFRSSVARNTASAAMRGGNGGNVGFRSLVVFVAVVVVMMASNNYVHWAEAVRRIERQTSKNYGGNSPRGFEFEGMSRQSFPRGFVFGTGSSAYQVCMQIC